MAAKRELMSPRGDKRYVRRDARGRIVEVDDVGRSLAQDRRRKAGKTAGKGQGDKGDRAATPARKGARSAAAKKGASAAKRGAGSTSSGRAKPKVKGGRAPQARKGGRAKGTKRTTKTARTSAAKRGRAKLASKRRAPTAKGGRKTARQRLLLLSHMAPIVA